MLAQNHSLSRLLRVDWRIRPYEMILLAFATIVVSLVSFFSPLPYSIRLAQVFLSNLAYLTLAVYGIAVLIVGFRFARQSYRCGWRSCLDKNVFESAILPYFSLDFLLLTLRRGLAIFGIIYFFLHLKHIILLVNTNNFDLFYWNLDRTVHFGIQPNIFLMQLIGPNPELSILLDYFYIKYFDFKIAVCLFFMVELTGRQLSERFFSAYAMLWAIGGLAYLITPSDGPCFAVLTPYAVESDDLFHVFKFPITTDIPLSYIQTYVNAKIPTAKGFQILLWEARHILISGRGLPGMFYGIAAMPSLHVAAVTLLSIFLYKAWRPLGIVGLLYLVIIFIGSIFLQWHSFAPRHFFENR